MQHRSGTIGFAPVWDKNSRALILGSYPSPKSFDEGFYYSHPQNRFWPLMASLLEQPTPQTIPQRTSFILQNNLALWDSLESCTILGASDASIINPIPNKIAALVHQSGITHVFCNGAAAHKYYKAFSEKETGLLAIKLPSTSAANAAFSMQRLAEAWLPLILTLTAAIPQS